MMYGTEGQKAAIESAAANDLRDVLGVIGRLLGGPAWYVVDLETGEVLPARHGLVAVDFNALDEHDRDVFETGSDFEVAALAARVGFTLDVMFGGES